MHSTTSGTDSYYDEDRLDENEHIASCLLGCISIPHVLRNKNELRSGKWTKEEEQFAFTIIQHFQAGTLCIPETATLRQCLSVALNCDAMRISKKFAGPYSIGKQVFTPLDRNHANYNIMKSVCAEELNIARSNWFRKLDEMDLHTFGRSRKRIRLDAMGRELFSSTEAPATILTQNEGAELDMLHKALIGLDKNRDQRVIEDGSAESAAVDGADADASAKNGEEALVKENGESTAPSVVSPINDERIPQVIAKIEKILKGEFSTTPSVLHLQAQMQQMQQSYLAAAQSQHQEMQQRVLLSTSPAALLYANTMPAAFGSAGASFPPAGSPSAWGPGPTAFPGFSAAGAAHASSMFMPASASAMTHAALAAHTQQQSLFMAQQQSMINSMASQLFPAPSQQFIAQGNQHIAALSQASGQNKQ